MGDGIEEIEGIGPSHGASLAEIRITTTDGYLEAAASPAGRKELAEPNAEKRVGQVKTLDPVLTY